MLARLGGSLVQPPHFAAAAVHDRSPRSVLPHQEVVVLLLHAAHAHHVTGVVELKLRLVEHVLGDFTHVAHQVRHEAIARIQPPVRHDRFQFRQFVFVRLDKRQLVRCDVFLQKYRLVLRHGSKPPDAQPHFVRVQVQPSGDHVRVGVQVARGIAQQQRGK